jgi:uncharacterized damage-inducible protein DinB
LNSSLEKLFASLEAQRTKLLAELSVSTSHQLNQQVKGKWSISQIAGHLITAEQLSVGYISKKINAINEVGSTGLLGEIKLWVFIVSQRLPLKYKAPKNLGDQPKSYPDLATLERDWNHARLELKTLLEKFPDAGLRKKIYRHPVMGRCSILHALIFFREHIIHHYPQIKRQL